MEGKSVASALRRAVLVLLAMILALTPSGLIYAALPDEGTLDIYNANGIYYYNGSAGDDCGPGSVGLVDGEGNAAYIWNWFAQAGIAGVSDNPAVIAGIMGNLNAETGLDPFEHRPGSSYYGLHQTYDEGMYKLFMENGWMQYLNYNSPSTAPPDVEAQAISLQLAWIVEIDNFALFVRNLDRVSDKSSPESYAELFLVTAERAVNGSDALQDSGVIGVMHDMYNGHTYLYQGGAVRRRFAREFYDQFANSTTNFMPVAGASSNVDAEGWVSGIEGLQKEPANLALTDDIVLSEYQTTNKKPNMIILHYTAGLTAGLAAYGSNYYPAHFTVDLKKKIGYQHFSLNQPSLAVSNYDGYAVQIEIVGCGYNGAGSAVDAGCMKASGGYSLDQLQPEDWDYLTYYLNTISAYTGIPLTTDVKWDENKERLSDEETRNYKGVMGHMHIHGTTKVDPGNIWPDVEAALKRNPSSTYNDACIPSGAVSGGLTLEQAQKFMQVYVDLMWATGDVQPKDNFVTEWTLYNTCSPSLANCSTFSQYFMNRYTASFRDNHFTHVSDGGKMVYRVLVEHAGEHSYVDGGHVPKAYALFSKAGVPGYGCTKADGFLGCGHTGIVLGVDEANNKIIIGESGCDEPDFTGAKERELSEFEAENYTYAYTDVLLDEIQKTISTGS